MITVGLYPGDSQCAVATAVDGTVVAALDMSGGPANDLASTRGMIADVLRLAGIDASGVDQLGIVNTGETAKRLTESPTLIWPSEADGRTPAAELVCAKGACAAQLNGHIESGFVLAQDDGDGAMLFTTKAGRLDGGQLLHGSNDAMAGAALVAAALGVEREPSAVAALERIAATRSRHAQQSPQERPPTRDAFGPDQARDLVARVSSACSQLAEVGSKHVGVQTARASLAVLALDAVADAVAAGMRAATTSADARYGLTGSAFAAHSFADRLAQRLPAAVVAPVCASVGGALGAALLPHAAVSPLQHLALGTAVSESEIKETLENCRLDYVYEPDWTKLLNRVSALLTTGALVGWFQGRRDFGGRSFGSRSVLADPSKRYARENVNVFLLRRDVDAPLPVSMLGSTWSTNYEAATSMTTRHVGFAADHQGRVLLQHQTTAVAPELAQLLEAHRERTGVAGLINVPLANRDGLVLGARDAIREAFSSAVDVLVIGRFLVSKDYWLIRAR